MIVACDECGGSTSKKPSQIKRTKHNFCSRSCANSYNNRALPKKKKKDYGSCIECGNSLRQGRIKFCNMKCKAKHYNKIKLSKGIGR